METKFNLGDRLREKITGFTGVTTGVCRYLTGCDQYLLQPEMKDGDFVAAKWFDEGRLEVVDVTVVKGLDVESENGTGPDIPAPIK